MASTNAYAVFGWDDTRNSDRSFSDNGTVGGGLQDVYVAAAQFEALGGGSSPTAKVVLAGAVGLLAVGLIVLVAAMVTRRRTNPPTGRAASREKSAAKVG